PRLPAPPHPLSVVSLRYSAPFSSLSRLPPSLPFFRPPGLPVRPGRPGRPCRPGRSCLSCLSFLSCLSCLVYWGICDWKSLDDMGGGPLTNQLRLLRGLVGLIQILVLLCVIAFVLSFFQRYRYAENQMWWSLATFVVALFVYFFAIIPAYWDAEFEVHSAIWSAFPKAP